MKARFYLLPVASLAVIQPLHATVYMSVEQAQVVMFPGATFSADFRMLSSEQANAIEKASGTNVLNRDVKVWRVSTGGWFIADEVVGKHEFIPIAVGLTSAGAIKDIEILEYRESYGNQVRDPAWRAQFVDKRSGAPLRLNEDVSNISGATLSSKHISDGVRRLLTTYALVLRPAES